MFRNSENVFSKVIFSKSSIFGYPKEVKSTENIYFSKKKKKRLILTRNVFQKDIFLNLYLILESSLFLSDVKYVS